MRKREPMLKRIVLLLWARVVWLPDFYRKYRFFLEAKLASQDVRLGSRIIWNVPTRIAMLTAGSIQIGDGCVLGCRAAPRLGDGGILIQPRCRNAAISIGKGTMISNNVSIIAMKSVEIGKNCQVGDLVSVFDCDFHEIDPATRNRSCGEIRPVSIGNNVWLGSRAMVLKGVTIGDNSVVAAMSVVIKSLPANCIAAGNPARIIRTLGPKRQREIK